jgi:membrane protein
MHDLNGDKEDAQRDGGSARRRGGKGRRGVVMFRNWATSRSLGMARKIVQAIHQDAVYDAAAGLAYYALSALVPFLLLCILLVGLVLDLQSPETIARILALAGFDADSKLVPETIREMIHGLAGAARGGFLIIAIGAAIWTASKATWALVRALDRVFHTKESRPIVHQRLIALAVTAVAGALSAVAVVMQTVLPVVESHLPALDLGIFRLLRVTVTGVLATLVWTALYRLLPANPPRRGIPSAGAVVGVIAWMLANWGFSLYLDHVQDFGAVYGAFGGILVLLLWLWISCFALLGGALVDRLRAEAHGEPLTP